MRRILLDSTGLYNAELTMEMIEEIHGTRVALHELEYDALLNVVSAIVLWDEVGIFRETFSSHCIRSLNYFNRYEDMFKEIDHVSLFHPKLYSDTIQDYIMEEKKEWEESGRPKEIEEIDNLFKTLWKQGKTLECQLDPWESRRAFSYLLTAQKNGMDYLPSVKRQAILQAFEFESFFLRQDILEKVDSELKKYYEQVNAHFKIKRIKYSAPILIDYLLDKYPAEDLIKAAFDLREKNSLVKFRREMDEVERAYNCGDVESVDAYFIQLEKMIKKVSGEIATQRRINITISFPPAISFDVDVPQIQKRLINSVFLKDLISYGIHERTPKSRGVHGGY